MLVDRVAIELGFEDFPTGRIEADLLLDGLISYGEEFPLREFVLFRGGFLRIKISFPSFMDLLYTLVIHYFTLWNPINVAST